MNTCSLMTRKLEQVLKLLSYCMVWVWYERGKLTLSIGMPSTTCSRKVAYRFSSESARSLFTFLAVLRIPDFAVRRFYELGSM